MQAWLLALVLVIICAIGAYYVHNTYSGINDYEGFDASGDSIVLKRAAEALCEREYQACLTKPNSSNAACTAIYNKCNTAAQALDISVSATSKPGSSTTTSSGPGALAFAKALGMTGAGDAVSWANSWKGTDGHRLDPLTTQIGGSTNPDESITKIIVPSANPDAAQGGEDVDILAEYKALVQKLKPDDTPRSQTYVIPKLASDVGTDADNGVDTNLSLRSQIRNEIKKAVHDEIGNMTNEYEVKYDGQQDAEECDA